MKLPTPEAESLRHQVIQALTPAAREVLALAIERAAALQLPLYLVGGPVRDALLGLPIVDLDLVVEGDAWVLAEALAAAGGGRLTQHAAFRTATVELEHQGQPLTIDVVTARRERYPAPAALPIVEPATIQEDLARRDFTINTLALRLLPDGEVVLLDPFNGREDLARRRLRVLHDASFEDDPTRILRAARFVARLELALEPQTRRLIDAAVRHELLRRTSPPRLLNELWLLLDEPAPERALALLHAWNALPQLDLTWSPTVFTTFPAARRAVEAQLLPQVYLALLLLIMTPDRRQAFVARYNLPAWARALARDLPQALALPLDRPLDAVALETLLRRFPVALLHALALSSTATTQANLRRYLDTIRPLPPLLSGEELRALGIAPGPAYGRILRALRQAQLSGMITTRAEALAWLQRLKDDEHEGSCYDPGRHSEV